VGGMGCGASAAEPKHKITVTINGEVLRDYKAVKITRDTVSGTLTIGCTAISFAALDRLIEMSQQAKVIEIMQEGLL